MSYIAELTPQVQAQPGQLRTSNFDSLPEGGILRQVYPRYYDSSTDPMPRGRCYVTIRLVAMLNNGTYETRGVVWRGYLSSGHAPSSFPNLKIPRNYFIAVETAMHSKAPANRIVRAICWVEMPEQGEQLTGSGGYIHQDEPGSGSGEFYVPPAKLTTSALEQVSNARDRLKLVSMFASWSTSASLGTRRVVVGVDKFDTTNTLTRVEGSVAPLGQANSVSNRAYYMNTGPACESGAGQQNMPVISSAIGNGEQYSFELLGTQSGDAGYWNPVFEIWAMP